jgi:cation transport ATPase
MENDWSSQLKKIEREFDGLPPEPSAASVRMQTENERRSQERAMQRRAFFGASARLLLVAALGVALAMWPYERSCGTGLLGYLFVESMMFIGGVWVAVSTWKSRLAKTHIVALMIALASLGLIAIEVLPRTGYAKVDPKHPPVWVCSQP